MKVIISRKGFDSTNGGVPSAIMPDGRLLPFPIPSESDPTTYNDIMVNGMAIGELVVDLTVSKPKNVSLSHSCHLDPDLDEGSLPRLPGWRPGFGQIDTAQRHLENQSVEAGDLFLFFGWFRQVEKTLTGWRYASGSPDMHVLYGWLRIGQIVHLGKGERPSPAAAFARHPHMCGRDRPSNTLYLATDKLGIADIDAPGGGIFRQLISSRILTDRSQKNRSVWLLPSWMLPSRGTTLTYHLSAERWQPSDRGCIAKSVAKGQEFVLRAGDAGALNGWVKGLFEG